MKKYAVFENIKDINKPNMLSIKNISEQQIRFEDSRNKINIFLLSLIIKSDKSFTEVFLECLKYNVSDDYYHRKLKNSLIRYLMEQVYDFEMRFNDYLKEQTRKINYSDNSSKLINKLCGKGKYNILNFNYTMPAPDKNINQCNIHGNIYDENIVIGINSEDVSIEESSYQFTKTFRVAEANTTNNYSHVINGLDEMIFFGHSLGMADYAYFRNIFDDVGLYENRNRIKLMFVYVTHGDVDDIEAKHRQVMNVSKLINKYVVDKGINNSGNEFFDNLIFKGNIQFKNVEQLSSKQ